MNDEASDDLDVTETITATVEDDGTVVVDDLVTVTDADGNVVATEETITVEAPDVRPGSRRPGARLLVVVAAVIGVVAIIGIRRHRRR